MTNNKITRDEKTNSQKAQPGDLVEVSLLKYSYEGVFLGTPSTDNDVVLIKMDSGYNIGLKKKDIFEIKVLKKAEQKKDNFQLQKDKEKPNIGLIITGGTIASRHDPKTGGVMPVNSPEKLFRFYPEIFEKVNVLKVEVPFTKASEDMDSKDWQKIARVAEKMLNDSNIRGIIITHGTDFLHYTSSALGFFLRNLNKPVVLTYSQRSIDRASSDANLNLQCAALAAISDIAEVMLVGHATTNDDYCHALPGAKVRKMHTSKRDTFKSINTEPIAKIYPDRIDLISSYNPRNEKKKVKIDVKFQEKVALIKIYPGQQPDILDFYLKNKYQGIVLEMSGIGQVPTSKSRTSWLTKLKEVQKRGMIVCATSQCIYGRVDPYVYSTARDILGTGVIYLEDMLSETALVKLGWVLAHPEWTKNKESIKQKMLENFSGEINKRV